VTHHGVLVARVYDAATSQSGYRVLVDRLWPRGLSKADVSWDEWCRDIAPTAALRRWYGHRPERFAEFRQRYLLELEDPDHAAAFTHLTALAGQQNLTLLTATKELTLSHAHLLAKQLSPERGGPDA